MTSLAPAPPNTTVQVSGNDPEPVACRYSYLVTADPPSLPGTAHDSATSPSRGSATRLRGAPGTSGVAVPSLSRIVT